MEEPGIHKIHIVEGNWKSMHDTKMIIQNKSYLTVIYTARNWDQNENGHKTVHRMRINHHNNLNFLPCKLNGSNDMGK